MKNLNRCWIVQIQHLVTIPLVATTGTFYTLGACQFKVTRGGAESAAKANICAVLFNGSSVAAVTPYSNGVNPHFATNGIGESEALALVTSSDELILASRVAIRECGLKKTISNFKTDACSESDLQIAKALSAALCSKRAVDK